MPAWKTLSRRIVFEAQPFLRVLRETVQVGPGQVIDDFWQVELRTFAVVVPMLAGGQVMMTTGYRHGPRRDCLGLPGGFVAPGEAPQLAALRELAEETGLRPARLIALGDYVDNGNQRGGHGHYFLALDCTAAGPAAPEPTEAATPRPMAVDEVEAALSAGQFGVIHHVAGWCLARRHPEFPADRLG